MALVTARVSAPAMIGEPSSESIFQRIARRGKTGFIADSAAAITEHMKVVGVKGATRCINDAEVIDAARSSPAKEAAVTWLTLTTLDKPSPEITSSDVHNLDRSVSICSKHLISSPRLHRSYYDYCQQLVRRLI